MQVVVDPELKPADLAVIRDGLLAYNDSIVDSDEGHIGILLKDDAGATIGGLTAHWYYSWMFIEYLFVPRALRGKNLGAQLMAEAERFARDRGLDGIWLDSYSFQALGFYEKLGYSRFGEIAGFPPGHACHFLCKRLDATPSTGAAPWN